MISFFAYNIIVVIISLNNQQAPFSITHDVVTHNDLISDGVSVVEKRMNNEIDDSVVCFEMSICIVINSTFSKEGKANSARSNGKNVRYSN